MTRNTMFRALCALALGCWIIGTGCQDDDDTDTDIDGGNQSSDTDSDADSDNDADSDSDSDAGAEPQPENTAYFVMNSLYIGDRSTGSCNVDGDKALDNRLLELVNEVTGLGGVFSGFKSTLNSSISNLVATRAPVVFALSGVNSFQNDNAVTIAAYEGQLEVDAGVTDGGVPGYLSGHGAIAMASTPYWSVDGATIAFNLLNSPPSTLNFGELIFNAELRQASIHATLNPLPDDQMLNGKMVNGIICGAIPTSNVDAIVDLFAGILTPQLRIMVKNYIENRADIKCDTTERAKDCLSFGMNFTAISVAKGN